MPRKLGKRHAIQEKCKGYWRRFAPDLFRDECVPFRQQAVLATQERAVGILSTQARSRVCLRNELCRRLSSITFRIRTIDIYCICQSYEPRRHDVYFLQFLNGQSQPCLSYLYANDERKVAANAWDVHIIWNKLQYFPVWMGSRGLLKRISAISEQQNLGQLLLLWRILDSKSWPCNL